MLFTSKSMAKYLKALEEMKRSVTADVQLSLEEKSRDVCARWEVCHVPPLCLVLP